MERGDHGQTITLAFRAPRRFRGRDFAIRRQESWDLIATHQGMSSIK